MLKFNEEEFLEEISSAARLREEIEGVVASQLERGIKNIYFIGSGGSYADMLAYEYLMRSRSELPSRAAIGPEFTLAPDATFGEGSLAIFGSSTGTTDDVNKVIEFAKARGAYTVGFTGKPDSPFAKALDHAFISSSHSYDIQLLLLLTKLMSERGEFDDYEKFADQIDSSNKPGVREKIVELAEEYFRSTAMTMTVTTMATRTSTSVKPDSVLLARERDVAITGTPPPDGVVRPDWLPSSTGTGTPG